MSDRHRAPRRKVLSITNTAGYGQTWWFHRLDCGHVEKRKRKAPADTIGCSTCVEEERRFTRGAVDMMRLPPETDAGSDEASVELQAGRVAAEVASRLRVPTEMVDVQVSYVGSGLAITGVSVWMPASAALALLPQK